jgi:hypothetical protein
VSLPSSHSKADKKVHGAFTDNAAFIRVVREITAELLQAEVSRRAARMSQSTNHATLLGTDPKTLPQERDHHG